MVWTVELSVCARSISHTACANAEVDTKRGAVVNNNWKLQSCLLQPDIQSLRTRLAKPWTAQDSGPEARIP